MSYKNIINCRICNKKVKELLDLNKQPLANSFHSKNIICDKYPLKLMLCNNCYHTQLNIVVNPNLLFKHYLYVSGTSNTLINYFKWFVEEFIQKKYLKKGSILDIACNDGSLLDIFKQNNWDTYGIDPAKNLLNEIQNKQHNLLCDYWNYNTSEIFKKKCETFDIINAQNVFAHLDNVHEFLQACKNVMSNKTILLIQTSQKNMIYSNEFDTIYHEHLSFFSIRSMIKVVELNGLFVNNVFFPDIHGISYLFEISKVKNVGNIYEELEKEKQMNRYDISLYEKYKNKCLLTKKIVSEKINKFKQLNKKIIGFGAAAKGTVFINFCNIHLDYIIDENTKKQELLVPGTNIMVKNFEYFLNEKEDIICIIFAWNFSKEITKKIKSNRPNNKDLIVAFYPKYIEY